MSLVERISQDLIHALKNKDSLRVLVLRLVKASVKNLAIEKRVQTPDDALTLLALQREAKKRKEAVAIYTQANRMDLTQKENDELAIIESYLPKQLSEKEVKDIIQKTIAESTEKNFGKLMKIIMPQVKGRSDGKVVQAMLKNLLEDV